MVLPDIIERQDRRTLDMLVFALDRQRMDRHAWRAATATGELGPAQEAPRREDGRWFASYGEHGGWIEIVSTPWGGDAAQRLHAKLAAHPTTYDHHGHWR